jgi:hypothetical protein
LRNDPPVLRAHLDPTAVTLSVAACMAGATALTGELPLPLAAPPVILLLCVARRFRRRSPTDTELHAIMALSTLATSIGFAASASRWAQVTTPLSGRTMPAAAFAHGSLVVLGAHWSRLGTWRRVLLPAVFAGCTAASLHRRAGRAPTELLAGTINLVQCVAATWRFTEPVDAEADHLETVLQRDFTIARNAARGRAAGEELERYTQQLAIARSAIAQLDDRLDAAALAQLEQDCASVERWLGH